MWYLFLLLSFSHPFCLHNPITNISLPPSNFSHILPPYSNLVRPPYSVVHPHQHSHITQPAISVYLTMASPPNADIDVTDLVARTEKCSCEEFRIELPSLQNESEVIKTSLIGKIISNRNFSYTMVKEIVSKVWNLSFPISVDKVDRNIFLFTFQHEANLNSVFRR
jgi:hypothetical protein